MANTAANAAKPSQRSSASATAKASRRLGQRDPFLGEGGAVCALSGRPEADPAEQRGVSLRLLEVGPVAAGDGGDGTALLRLATIVVKRFRYDSMLTGGSVAHTFAARGRFQNQVQLTVDIASRTAS